jgi:hypothetical protein
LAWPIEQQNELVQDIAAQDNFTIFFGLNVIFINADYFHTGQDTGIKM